MIHVKTPYRVDKNLGKAYNDAFEQVSDDDWIVLRDHDTLFLTHDAIKIIGGYTALLPDAGLLTCYTNRIHHLAKEQLIDGTPSENDSVRYWQVRAEKQREKAYSATEITREVSGFLMVVCKRTWRKHKFIEQPSPLGVDNDFCWRILSAGLKIYRMDAVLVWHSYRLNDITDKSHLR